MSSLLRILMLTSQWPTPDSPHAAPFVLRQVELLRGYGFEVEVFHFRGAKAPINYLRAWRRVQDRLSRRHYDLVHAQWGQSALPALPCKLPLVVTFRGSDLEGIVGKNGRYAFSGRVLKAISNLVARRANQVIVVAERLARHIPEVPYHVIPSGIDMDLFRPIGRDEARRQLGLLIDRPLILFAGDPAVPVKRYQLAQDAVAEVASRFGAELVVCNGLPHIEVPLYMNACDVLLLTSQHEGSSNVVKEALACDLPVVSVDVGDVRERIGHVNGCVICHDDGPSAIADGLSLVLERNRRIDGRSGVQHLDERILTQKIIEVYQEAVSNRGL